MNKVHIIGRLTRDPEVRYSQGDNATATARFTLAVDRKFKKDGQQDADFIGCIAFGKIAEHIEKYYKQGMKMVLSGRIATGSYTNKEGVKVYTTDVVAEEVEFAESKSGGGDTNNSSKSKPNPNEKLNEVDDSVDSELPFN